MTEVEPLNYKAMLYPDKVDSFSVFLMLELSDKIDSFYRDFTGQEFFKRLFQSLFPCHNCASLVSTTHKVVFFRITNQLKISS